MSQINEPLNHILLGDLLQKISQKSYEEIKLLIDSFSAQSPQLRTEKLIILLNKLKKRFGQLFVILKWLNEEHVIKYLKSTTNLLKDVNEQNIRLNIKQDSLYYLHSSLYIKRIKSIEINESYEILLKKTYNKLPSSIILCGEKPEYTQLNKDYIQIRLETLIRSKLLLYENIPNIYNEIKICNGYLILKKLHSFEVILSLSNITDYTDNWTIINVNILTHHHERERLLGESDPQEINKAVFQSLQRLLSIPNCPQPLTYIGKICLYSSLSHSLRLLYVQALDMVRTTLISTADATYTELPDKIIFTCTFWKVKKLDLGNQANITATLTEVLQR